MVELLKQPQYQPLHVVDQIMVIYAGTRGFLDKVPVNEVQRWTRDFLNFVHTSRKDVWTLLDEKKDEGDTMKDKDNLVLPKVKAVLEEYARQYAPKKTAEPAGV
jgi:F-type H+-transporting ATPase subunit alpha